MMDVQVMRGIVDEIEAGRLPDVALEAALRWCDPTEVGSLTYLRSSASFIFHFQHAGRLYYLRLAHASERSADAIAAELDFVRHVADAGLATALPVASHGGRLIEEVASARQRYSAVVFEGLQGSQPEWDELDAAGYRAWGRALAQLHAASQTFPQQPARPVWRDDLRATLAALPAEETIVAQTLAAGLRWLDVLTPPAQDYGLLHGDFELDNLVWDGERAQALDFDDAAYAWYAVDFAAALQDVWLGGDTGGVSSAERTDWFLQGYATLRPLPAGLHEALQRLFPLVMAHKIARMLRAYATTNESGNPEWVDAMRGYHQRWLAEKRATLAWR